MKKKINIQFLIITLLAILTTVSLSIFVFYELFKQEVMADLKEDIPANLKVPHMGWNSLHLTEKGKEHPLFKYSKEGDYVYFVHSFYGKDCEESLLATSEYGIPVTASAANGNVMGCQFHPEKSGEVGLRILKAFSEI